MSKRRSKLMMEIKTIGHNKASWHGLEAEEPANVSELEGYRFRAAGISKKTGKRVLYIPHMADIISVDAHGLNMHTSQKYFKRPSTKLKLDDFVEKLMEIATKEGYYVCNHINRRVKFVGSNWDKTYDNLVGNYLGLDIHQAITSTPPDCSPENYLNTMEIRQTAPYLKVITISSKFWVDTSPLVGDFVLY